MGFLFVTLTLGLLTYAVSSTSFLVEKQSAESSMNITAAIKYNGYYSVEEHNVITKDGYILGLQRIPCKKLQVTCSPGKPVLLQHGLLDSAQTWANNPGEKSLAFYLVERGYDVWLGNSRGNTYSKAHLKYNVKSKEFWDFTVDEQAFYDVPATIDYILQKTLHHNLSYVGHSQGSSIAFIYFNQHPEMSHKVSSMAMLGPVAYVGNLKSSLALLGKYLTLVFKAFQLVGNGEFLPSSKTSNLFVKTLCSLPLVDGLCTNALFFLAGPSGNNIDKSRYDVYLRPGGTSIRNMLRYAQAIKHNQFMAYDYGHYKNIEKYGQTTPPKYGLDKIQIPTALFSGGNDQLSNTIDVERLVREYNPIAMKMHDKIDHYAHLDFVWGSDAYLTVYPKVERFIRSYA